MAFMNTSAIPGMMDDLNDVLVHFSRQPLMPLIMLYHVRPPKLILTTLTHSLWQQGRLSAPHTSKHLHLHTAFHFYCL